MAHEPPVIQFHIDEVPIQILVRHYLAEAVLGQRAMAQVLSISPQMANCA
jgi:hypothetical protein